MPRLEFASAVPEGWAYSKLADACELISRGRSPQYVDHSPVRAIGQRCVRDSFDGSAARGQNPNRLEGHLKALPGDVLLNSTGTGTIGRSCVFNDAGDFVVDSHVTVIRPQPKKLHPQWVNMMLRSPQGQTNLETFCYAGSTNQVELARTPLAETEIPLPPLPEQRRIAAILDTLDRTIEGTQRVIEKLQATRQGLLHDLLTRGLDERGQLRDPERNPEQFKETELGRVPGGWTVISVGEAAAPTPGSSTIGPFGSNLTARDYRESGVPVVFVRDIKEDGFVWRSQVYLDVEKAKSLRVHGARSGDVLATKMGDPPCISCVYPAWMAPGIITADVIRITVDTTRIRADWLSLYVNSPQVMRQVQWISGGVTRSKVTLKDFRNLLVAMPELREQERILHCVELNSNLLRAEQARLAKLRALKRGLMEDLLTGRVRVPVHEAQDRQAGRAVRPDTEVLPQPNVPLMPPPMPVAAQPRALFRAGAGADVRAMTEWTRQLQEAVQGQQVVMYSHAALDAVLPELLALSATRDGLLRVPELLARAGIRFMLLPHPRGSRTSGAAFYLDEPGRTQPVVGLSFLRPYLDVFWFNLLHELGHLRLGHEPVPDESLERGDHSPDSADEGAANTWARNLLIPEAKWQPFLAAGLHGSNRIKRFAGKLDRHPAIVAGRLGYDTGNWDLFNSPDLRPTVRAELAELAARLAATP